MTFEEFINRFDAFTEMKPSAQIPYFCYYLTEYQGKASFVAKDIEDCFETLNLPPYSNISAFLSAQKKAKRFLKRKTGGYALSRVVSEGIARELGEVKRRQPSSELFPVEIFDSAYVYLRKTASEVALCYDNGLYTACFVMARRLLESLIIDVFEHFGEQNRIKNAKGNYFYCSDLIDALVSKDFPYTVGRNAVEGMKRIKKLGDLCAHNRHFNATKSDVDGIKLDLRVVFEELIHLLEVKV